MTPEYASPEQVRGEEVDPRMDLYSITVVLYRMLTHKLPFQGDTAVAMIHSQLHNPPTLLAGLLPPPAKYQPTPRQLWPALNPRASPLA